MLISHIKVHIFWEGHKILQNIHLTYVLCSARQKWGGDFAKFCGHLRIYELYNNWTKMNLSLLDMKYFLNSIVTTAITATKWSSKRLQIHLWQIITTTVTITDNIAHFCPMCHLLHLHWTLVIVVHPVCRACIAQLIHRITI